MDRYFFHPVKIMDVEPPDEPPGLVDPPPPDLPPLMDPPQVYFNPVVVFWELFLRDRSPSEESTRCPTDPTDSDLPALEDPVPPTRTKSVDQLFPTLRSCSYDGELSWVYYKWRKRQSRSLPPIAG